MRTDGQTDKAKLIDAFRNFANVAKKLGNTNFPRFLTSSQVKHKGNASDAQGLVRVRLFVLCVIYLTLSTGTALLQSRCQEK